MRITDVTIEGLWGHYQVNWTLNKDVTILSGINGSGKSTILRAMATMLQSKPSPEALANKLRKISIKFEDGYVLSDEIYSQTEDPNELQINNSHRVTRAFDEIKKKYTDTGKAIALVSAQRFYVIDSNTRTSVNPEEFLKQINVDFISTFDCPPPKHDDPNQYLKYLVSSAYSELDRHLDAVVERYKSYQVELSTRMAHMMSEVDTKEEFEGIKALSSKRLILQDKMDDLLRESGKHINREKGDVEFIFHSDQTSHSYKDLSAGEKQLLLIMLTVFMQEDKETILIMDEPEISLHVDWQRQLIDIIRSLNPNCQIIVSTHSPAMILNGWQGCVDNISDLAKQE